MNAQVIIILIFGIICLGYILTVTAMYGVRPSISESWYEWPNDAFGPLAFTLFTWSISILLVCYDWTNTWFWFAAMAMSIVGVMGQYKEKVIGTMHVVGSLTAPCLAFAGIGFEYHNWYPAIGVVAVIIILKLLKIKNFTWWEEIAALVGVIVGLTMHQL